MCVCVYVCVCECECVCICVCECVSDRKDSSEITLSKGDVLIHSYVCR